jgi:hypothetical protein
VASHLHIRAPPNFRCPQQVIVRWALGMMGGLIASLLRMSDRRGAALGGLGQAARCDAPLLGRPKPWAFLIRPRRKHQRANLEEFEADSAAGGIRKGGFGGADAPQGTDQHIGHRGEPQAQWRAWTCDRHSSRADTP